MQIFKKLITLISLIGLLTLPSRAQDGPEAIVKNSDGEVLAGASVSIIGTSVFVVAGDDGSFELAGQTKFPLSIRVSSVGYRPKTITVSSPDDFPKFVLLEADQFLSEIVVTSRRRNEVLQDVPIAVTVIGGELVENSGAFNVNRAKELVPSVQLYSSNPRNTTLNIRGLGSTFGLTNDGIDPGVGFYVDGVYYARPAATSLDFVDVERIEVLRGPQGTLFGHNTTAGAFSVTTRKPSFSSSASFESTFGNYGFVQAKASVTGPLGDKVAARLSLSGTQRDGLVYNTYSQQYVNDLNNLGIRGQLLYLPSEGVELTLGADFSRQRPNGYAHVVAGVLRTKRADFRQFDRIAADLGYTLPSTDPFDRLIDHNTNARSGNDLGGVSLNADIEIGDATLTSTTAWRYWNWDPSSDRDFTSLDLLSLSQAPSVHQQWSQEVRYAGSFSDRFSGVLGVFLMGQNLESDAVHTEETGSAWWRFAQSSESPLWATPGLFDGFGIRTYSTLKSLSGAVFGQLDWQIIEGLHILPGLRFNYDKKDVVFDRQTYGGLQTEDPALIALKEGVYSNQAFNADVSDTNVSGQLTVAYKASDKLNVFAIYANSYKPVGVNLGGLPRANGEVLLDLAQIKPEYLQHLEFGLKTSPTSRSILNLTLFNTDINDFQTQVQTPDPGVNRGYLANAEKVRVRGLELDGNIRFDQASLYAALAYTEGTYVKFENAPVPLEETGSPQAFKDISGGSLPGISKWTTTFGGELSQPARLLRLGGDVFAGIDAYYRSSFSSNPSPSQYLNIDGYFLLNGRVGFRASEGLSVFLWSRNLLNKDYFEQLLPVSGGSGLYAGVLGDPRTYGLTLRYQL